MKNFFEYYNEDYLNKSFDKNDSGCLMSIRHEDIFLEIWRSFFMRNIPYNETELFY